METHPKSMPPLAIMRRWADDMQRKEADALRFQQEVYADLAGGAPASIVRVKARELSPDQRVARLSEQCSQAVAELKTARGVIAAQQAQLDSFRAAVAAVAAERDAFRDELAKLAPIAQAMEALAAADREAAREYVSPQTRGISRALNTRAPNRYGLPLYDRHY